jgi:hypothetical protein
MTEMEKIIAGVLAANMVGLNFKIVYDWLKSRKEVGGSHGGGTGGCPLHSIVQQKSDQMEAIVSALEKSFKVHEAVADERIAKIRLDMARGQEVFDAIQASLLQLSQGQATGAALMAEINRRLIAMESRPNGNGNK